MLVVNASAGSFWHVTTKPWMATMRSVQDWPKWVVCGLSGFGKSIW
jgi:hypothetical protein